ncbi:MAG: ATP-binding cassette domain-containing protein [Thiolinea sp.]
MIGDNGAGKSSLIKAISGAVVPDEGEVKLDGKKVNFTRRWKRGMPGLKPCIRIWPCRRPCRLPIIWQHGS